MCDTGGKNSTASGNWFNKQRWNAWMFAILHPFGHFERTLPRAFPDRAWKLFQLANRVFGRTAMPKSAVQSGAVEPSQVQFHTASMHLNIQTHCCSKFCTAMRAQSQPRPLKIRAFGLRNQRNRPILTQLMRKETIIKAVPKKRPYCLHFILKSLSTGLVRA